MIFKPRAYQDIMVNHMCKHERSAVWAGMGMGKTSACLQYIDYLRMYNSDPVLVIAPLRVARDVWPVEIQKWDNFKHLTCSSIIGTPAQRTAALTAMVDIHTVNYENLQWLLKAVGTQWPWRTVILDESTKVKSFRLRKGGVRAQALAKMTWTKIERLVELTGTPNPNGLLDLWGQLWFIDKGERLGRTYTTFSNLYFRYAHPNSFKLVPIESAFAQIQAKVKDICMSLKPEDWFDLEEPIHYKVPVYLDHNSRTKYDKLQQQMFVKLQSGTTVEANFAAALTIKSLQFANGAMYTEEGIWEEVHQLKLEALSSIIAELPGENIIVAYHFKSDLSRLQKYFPQGRKLDQDPNTLKQWNEGKIPLLFAHPASAGHGLNMQDGGRTIVFFGHWWDLEQRLQIIERVGPVRQFQAGYKRSVFVYDIYVHNTVDEIVLSRHESKKSIQELLLNAVRKGI